MIKKLLFVFFLTLWTVTAQAAGGVNIFAYPREIPDEKVFDADGRAVSLKDLSGDFLILVFWSKTCIPCLRELDNLNEFVNKTKGTGIKVLLISSDSEWENPDEQKMVLRKYGASDVDFYLDHKSSLANKFGIFTSPHAVLVDKDSMEIGRIRGAVEWDDEDVIEYIYKIKAQH